MAPVVRAAVVVCLACGCSAGNAGTSAKPAVHPHVAAKPTGARTLSSSAQRVRGERPVQSEAVTLSASSEAGVDHQVRMLRKSIALYEQFIERAAGQPDMKEAVQRSRERIEDAEETIRFLLQKSPPAP
jgi:hypothetical protein